MTTQTLPKNWARSTVAKAATVIMGQSPDSQFVNEDEVGIPFLQGNAEFTDKYPSPAHWVTKPTKLSNKDDILISVRAPVGEMNIADKEYCIGRGLAAIRFSEVDNRFGWYAIAYHKDQLSKLAQGSTFTAISSKDFSIFEIIHPIDSVEQRAIADILSTLDEAITQSESLVRKYQSIKQGLMSDLLMRGVDENGELRPENKTRLQKSPFGLFPMEWEVVLMDKVAIRGSGHTPSRSHPEYWNGGIKWVSLADSSKLDKVFISETDKNISELGIQNSSAVKHPAGTVIISRDAGIGKSAIITDEMAVSQHFIAWTCGKRLTNLFLYYWLQYRKRDFESIAFGSTIQTIGLQYFRDLKVVLPPLEEQKSIAEILFTAEKMIDEEAANLGKLNYLKQGLMQDLLSGQVRVKV